MNAGSGKVMYLAGDATWRLRQVNGQNLHERFWGQVVRWVVGNDLPAGGQFVRFGSDKPKYVDGEPAVITAKLKKKDFAPLSDAKVKVVARQLSASGAGRPRRSRDDRDPRFPRPVPRHPRQPAGRAGRAVAGGRARWTRVSATTRPSSRRP